MKMKIILIFVVLLFTIGIVCGENETDDTMQIEDTGNYIHPSSVSSDLIQFSDGFTGFCLDNSKDTITTSDKFTLGRFSEDNMENNIKLAIIECYKQGKENEIGKIISQLESRDSSSDVVKEVLSSAETIGKTSVVEIDNSTEATFTFELLKSVDENKSDVLAYTVSMEKIESNDTNSNTTPDNSTDDKNTNNNANILGKAAPNKTDDLEKIAKNKTDNLEKIAKNKTDNNKTTTPEKTTENETDNNQTTAPEITTGANPDNNKTSDDKNTDDNKNKNDTETANKTVVNKTKTVIVNETNTTVVNNVKTINNTTDEPQNDTVSNIIKTVGNPIVILIIVIIIIAIVFAVVRRKD